MFVLENSKKIILSTLSQNSNIIFNKNIAEQFGIINSIFLSAIFMKYETLSKINQTDEDWFWWRQEDIKKLCCLSFDQQTASSSFFVQKKILLKEKRGLPAKNYYKIEFENLIPYLLQNSTKNNVDKSPGNCVTSPPETPAQNINNIQSKTNDTSISKDISVQSLILDCNKEPGLCQASPTTDNRAIINELSKIPIVRKLNRRDLPPSPSLAQSASKGMKDLAKKKAEQIKLKEKVTPFQNISEEIEDTMSTWEKLGFKIPDKEKAPKGFNDTIRALKKIQEGRLIPNEKRKFSIAEIKTAMTRFSMIVFDQHGFYNDETRKKLSTKSLKDFLYSPDWRTIPDWKHSRVTSWMIKCLDSPPLEKSPESPEETLIEDKHPIVTNKLKSFFTKYVLAGIKKKLNTKEENKFREGSNKICEIYDKFSHRFVGVDGYLEMADILCESIHQCYGEKTTKVYPGSFSSSFAMSRMIALMNEKGYIPDAGFQIEF